MTPNEMEIRENLADAGCGECADIFLACIRDGDTKGGQKVLSTCRDRLLEELHEDQRRIDRLDYLTWQMKL